MAGTYIGRMVVTVGGTAIACMGNTSPDINPGITAGEVANGSPYNQAFVYKSGSKATASIEAPWATAVAAVADTTAPATAKSVVFAWPNGGVTFGSALLEQFTVSNQAQSFAMVKGTFTNQGDPTTGGSGSGPITVNPPLFQAVTATTLGGNSANIASYEATWNNSLITFYGASGSSYPSEYIFGGVKASGKFTAKFNGTGELAQLLGSCPTSGTATFSAASQCGSSAVALTCRNVYYASWKITQGFNQATMEEIDFLMITTDGSTAPLAVA